MNKPHFTINLKTVKYSICDSCKGSGRKEFKFRQKIYISDCGVCQGEGRIAHVVNQEYPLEDALRELNINQ